MNLLLVHHGEAVGPDVDPMRPLSSRGRDAAEGLAADVARLWVKPDALWHSGKLRARQTAELFWRACNPFASVKAVRGLQPADAPEWIRDQLAGEARSIIVVGHMPHLARLLALLHGGDSDRSPLVFPLHGCVALEPDGARWKETWRRTPRFVTPTGGP